MVSEGERGHSRVRGASKGPTERQNGKGQDVSGVSAGAQQNKSKSSASASAAAVSGDWVRAVCVEPRKCEAWGHRGQDLISVQTEGSSGEWSQQRELN